MDLLLPESVREKLKKPFGKLHPDIKSAKKDISGYVIAVGDKVSIGLLKEGIRPDICIYDGMTKREKIAIPDEIRKSAYIEIKVKNPAGMLSGEAVSALNSAIKSRKKTNIYVEGEEDLLALPAIKDSPADAIIIYGQPDEGVVLVRADSKTKAKAKKILDEMIEK
jgi:GTP-dependent dephospho-CoA kinase